jgi:hypothetical protein
MEIPYSLLLRIGFALWWRYYALWLTLVIAIAAPLLLAAWLLPSFAEALAASRIDRDFFLLGALPVMEALIAFPIAVRWFQRSRAVSFGVTVHYHGVHETVLSNPQRQQILFGWSVFFMPLAWEVLNALLIHVLFAGAPETPRVWASIAAIYANVALLQALVFLPMNLNWAFQNRFAGVQWTLTPTPPDPASQPR